MKIGITCYPTYGGSGVVATELGIELAALGLCTWAMTQARNRGREPGGSRSHTVTGNAAAAHIRCGHLPVAARDRHDRG